MNWTTLTFNVYKTTKISDTVLTGNLRFDVSKSCKYDIVLHLGTTIERNMLVKFLKIF